MKFRDVVDMLHHDGWALQHVRGSHMIYRHPRKPGTVVLPAGGKLNRDIKPGTLNSVLKQAGLKQ